MGCVRIALEQLGIPIKQYLASEIDKYPIQITQKNYPDTIQLGDITKVFAKDLPPIDILVGGSPCQGFSFAGDQLAFDDPRSALFFEFVRLLKECKPKYFLLENVRMKKEFLDVITEQVGGIEPILINSKLVSAQNRQRYYWTNIEGVEQPKDLGLVLEDILEDSDWDANYFKGGNQLNPDYKGQANTIHDVNKKSGTIYAGTHGYANGYVTGAWRGRYNKDGSTTQKLELRRDEKTNALTTVQKDNVVISKRAVEKYVPDKDAKFCDPYNKKTIKGDKSTTLRTNSSNGNMWVNDSEVSWRKLTPLECERLQTVPDNYTEGVSNTQRYKMLGNGMTVEVIKHIFKSISRKPRPHK